MPSSRRGFHEQCEGARVVALILNRHVAVLLIAGLMSDAVRMGASSRLFQCENAPEAATVKGLAGSDRALAATVTNAAQTSAAAAPARSATAAPPRLRRSDFARVEVDDNGHAD